LNALQLQNINVMNTTLLKEPTQEQVEDLFAADRESAEEVSRMTREERVELEQSARSLSRSIRALQSVSV